MSRCCRPRPGPGPGQVRQPAVEPAAAAGGERRLHRHHRRLQQEQRHRLRTKLCGEPRKHNYTCIAKILGGFIAIVTCVLVLCFASTSVSAVRVFTGAICRIER